MMILTHSLALRRIFSFTIALALMFALLPPVPKTVSATPTELFISEYIEGSSYNKAIEIFNGTGSTIDLAAGSYNLQMFFNGSATAGLTINLNGSFLNGDVWVVAHASANAAILAQADQTNASGWFNGNDAVVLRKGATIIDAIGQIGFDPGSEWGTGLTSTMDNTLRRKGIIEAGDTNGSDAFDPSLEWDGYTTDTFDGLGTHSITLVDTAPTVLNTTPANGELRFPYNADLTVTFSEPVNVADGWFSLSCTTGGSHTAIVTGGPSAYTINPDVDLADGDSCTLTVLAANVSDVDTNDPPDAMAADYKITFTAVDLCGGAYTSIYTIQGSGDSSPVTGEDVLTRGVIVGDFEGISSGGINGFYLQDTSGDANAATSDGLFVYQGSGVDEVSLGDVVWVYGQVSEYQTLTEITAQSLGKCGTDTVTPVDLSFPRTNLTDLEPYEGMLVRLPQTMYVTETYYLGRFGQVTLSSRGRLPQPTGVATPGAPALTVQAANDLNRIILDDANNSQNTDPIVFGRGGLPLSASNTLRSGDTAANTVGVLTYGWSGNSASGNAWRLRPVNALGGSVNFEPTNPRPMPPQAIEGRLVAGGMNLLNYFNTFGTSSCSLGVGGGPTECRGADNETEFTRQADKLVAAIMTMDPAVLGIAEIENDGYGPASAIQDLVDRLNAATGAGRWAFIDADAAAGQLNALGTDAIKVGLLYRPALVTPVGDTAVLNTETFVNGGDSAARNRPALAQAFAVNANGARFTAVMNHLKSKGSACDAPDAGDGQGNCNLVRTNAANELAAWLASDPTHSGDPDVLILGDLNSYAMEDPITALKNAGYADLASLKIGAGAYSYVFDGQWGYLDYAMSSPSLTSQVSGMLEWHINADEPSALDYDMTFKSIGQQASLYAADAYRSADHDMILVGLYLTVPVYLPVVAR